MLNRIRKKKRVDKSVHELALERLHVAYDLLDNVVVSFSGGKDSTACLNLTIEVARDRGRLPVPVFFYDEEAIPHETEHYVRRVAQREDVSLRWMCIPGKYRNGCSFKSPWWYPWAPEVRHLWVRDPPPEGEFNLPGFPENIEDRPKAVAGSVGLLFDPREWGNVGMVMGIRADESITRTRAILMRNRLSGNEYFIKNFTEGVGNRGNIKKIYPVYDWSTEDIWLAPGRFGWDYNRAYDAMEKAGLSHHQQRCAPPFGEEMMRGLWTFATCFPDVWDKMQLRVPGAATAARLATTVLYSHGEKPQKPADVSWEQFINYWIAKHPSPEQPHVRSTIAMHIKSHYGKTAEPIMPTAQHPLTGLSWDFLLMIAVRGDYLNRKSPIPSYGDDMSKMDKRRAAYDAERRALEKEGEGGEETNPEADDER